MHARNIRLPFPLLTPHSRFHQSGFPTRLLQPFFFFFFLRLRSRVTQHCCARVSARSCVRTYKRTQLLSPQNALSGYSFPQPRGSVSRLCEKSFDTSATICGFKFVLVAKWPNVEKQFDRLSGQQQNSYCSHWICEWSEVLTECLQLVTANKCRNIQRNIAEYRVKGAG